MGRSEGRYRYRDSYGFCEFHISLFKSFRHSAHEGIQVSGKKKKLWYTLKIFGEVFVQVYGWVETFIAVYTRICLYFVMVNEFNCSMRKIELQIVYNVMWIQVLKQQSSKSFKLFMLASDCSAKNFKDDSKQFKLLNKSICHLLAKVFNMFPGLNLTLKLTFYIDASVYVSFTPDILNPASK